jgi:hypothetical protein
MRSAAAVRALLEKMRGAAEREAEEPTGYSGHQLLDRILGLKPGQPERSVKLGCPGPGARELLAVVERVEGELRAHERRAQKRGACNDGLPRVTVRRRRSGTRSASRK